MGAGIFYYRSLVEAHLARGLSPQLLMVHADVRRVLGLAAARETRELATYLAGLLGQLAGGGAEIATIPAFAPQICARELAEMTPLPLISLLDAIAAEVERRKLQRVAIFGARVTMETKLFGRLESVEVVDPSAREIDLVSSAYGRIVQEERASAEDFAALRGLPAHTAAACHRTAAAPATCHLPATLIERERLDAILLAGTDLAFVFHAGNIDFPYLDGARTHIDAIMRQLAPR